MLRPYWQDDFLSWNRAIGHHCRLCAGLCALVTVLGPQKHAVSKQTICGSAEGGAENAAEGGIEVRC